MPDTWFVVEKGGRYLMNYPNGPLTAQQWGDSILGASRFCKHNAAERMARNVGGRVVAYCPNPEDVQREAFRYG